MERCLLGAFVEQVNGFCKPKLANQWRLLNQVHEAMHPFEAFNIAPCPKGTVNVAVNQLAQAAIASHLAGDASSSSAGASTSGAIDNVAEHAGIADDSRRYVYPMLVAVGIIIFIYVCYVYSAHI